jgi:hypothetical protein
MGWTHGIATSRGRRNICRTKLDFRGKDVYVSSTIYDKNLERVAEAGCGVLIGGAVITSTSLDVYGPDDENGEPVCHWESRIEMRGMADLSDWHEFDAVFVVDDIGVFVKNIEVW